MPLVGSLAFHSYSSYLAAPTGDGDGHIFLLSLPDGPRLNLTRNLPVENAMNPQFAPDGATLVFMAIPKGAAPSGTPRDYAGLGAYLEVFSYDLGLNELTRLTWDRVPDEDPRYSPDGRRIVFKRGGQIWEMNADGSCQTQLTLSEGEKSGPCYSPDGTSIAYWANSGAEADIWRLTPAAAAASPVAAAVGISDYYPLYCGDQALLFVRWASPSDRTDQIFRCSLETGSCEALVCNLDGVDDSDPFLVDGERIGFSSTRDSGDYDLFIAEEHTGKVYPIEAAATPFQDFGGCYSRRQLDLDL